MNLLFLNNQNKHNLLYETSDHEKEEQNFMKKSESQKQFKEKNSTVKN